MNPSDINNIYSLLAVVVPSVTTILGTVIVALISNRNKKAIEETKKDTTEKLDEVKKEATIATQKIDNINTRQEVMHDAINSQQSNLIAAIRKSAYAEGIIEGIKKEQSHMAQNIIDELNKNELIKQDQQAEAAKIINNAVAAKDKLIEEAILTKQQLDANIIKLKEDILHELNQKLLRDK